MKAFVGPDAVEYPPVFLGDRYVDPPPGTEKWFRLEPADGGSPNNLLRIPFADWSRGKKGTGGVGGHSEIDEAEY